MRSMKWFVMLLVCSVGSFATAADGDAPVRRVARVQEGDAAPPTEVAPARRAPERNLFALTHAVTLRPDGMLEGTCSAIDSATLQEFPVPNVDVVFVQNARVVASARTNAMGTFVARGLTAQSVYSVIVRSSQWFSANSVAILSADAVSNNQTAAKQNATVARLASMVKNSNITYAPSLSLGLIPNADFAASGLAPNNDGGGGGAPIFGGMGGGGGGFGGGGGGGGLLGGGGGGLGGLLGIGAAAAAIGIAAGDDDDVASPF